MLGKWHASCAHLFIVLSVYLALNILKLEMVSKLITWNTGLTATYAWSGLVVFLTAVVMLDSWTSAILDAQKSFEDGPLGIAALWIEDNDDDKDNENDDGDEKEGDGDDREDTEVRNDGDMEDRMQIIVWMQPMSICNKLAGPLDSLVISTRASVDKSLSFSQDLLASAVSSVRLNVTNCFTSLKEMVGTLRATFVASVNSIRAKEEQQWERRQDELKEWMQDMQAIQEEHMASRMTILEVQLMQIQMALEEK